MNCEVTKIDNYKETMFDMLPQLKYLDNADNDGGKKNEMFFISHSLCFYLEEKDSDEDDDDDEDELEEDNEDGGK